MVKRTRFSNDTVTAGKFVEIGRKSVDLKSRLERVSQLVSSTDQSASINAMQQITADNFISPEEKKKLADEWKHIQSAYSSTVSTVTGLGVTPAEFLSFQSAFTSLKAEMESILSDMSKPSTSGDLDIMLQAYQSAATILQNWINSYNNSLTADISNYRLDVESSPVSPAIDDEITFTAKIYIDGVDRTADMINQYKDENGLCPSLFDWNISGANNDEELMGQVKGKQSFTIPGSSLSGDSIKVFFSASVNIG